MTKKMLAGLLAGIMVFSQAAPMYAQDMEIPEAEESVDVSQADLAGEISPGELYADEDEAPDNDENAQESFEDILLDPGEAFVDEGTEEEFLAGGEDASASLEAEELYISEEVSEAFAGEDINILDVSEDENTGDKNTENDAFLPEDTIDELIEDEDTDLEPEAAGAQNDVIEPWIERQFGFGDRSMLRGWEDFVDRWYNCYVEGAEYPDGMDFPLEVTNVSVEDEDGQDVAFIEEENENGWRIRAANHGIAKVNVTYTDWDGTEGHTEEYRLFVGNDVYDIWMDSDGGTYLMLPGRSLNLFAGINHQIEDPETGEQRQCTEEEMAGITFTWEIPEEHVNPEWKDLITVTGNGKSAVLSVKNPPANWDPGDDRGVGVVIKAFEGGEEVASTERFFTVSQHYAQIWPAQLNFNFKPGTEQKITPEVRFYDFENEDDYTRADITQYRWYYDDNCIEILDEDGKAVGNDPDGEYRDSEASWGNGRTFTIRRLREWMTNIHLEIDGDEWGTVRADYWLPDQDVWFDFDLRDGDQVFSDGTRSFFLNLDNYQEMDYELEAEAGVWENDDFVQTFKEGDGWSLDRKNGVLTLDGAALYEKDLDNIEVRVKAIVGDRQISETQHGFPIREARINFNEADENLFPGEERDIPKEMNLWVEDTLFPDREVHARIKKLTCTSEEDEYDNRDTVTVEERENSWHFTAVRYGAAEITVTLELYDDHGNRETKEVKTWYWVDDYRAYIDIRSSSGSFNMGRGEKLNLISSVNAEVQEENGHRYNVDTSEYRLEYDVWVEWVDDNWWRSHNEDWETTTERGRFWDFEVVDNNNIRIIAKDDGPDMDIHVNVRAFDHDDENEWQVREEGRTVFIHNELYKVTLKDDWDENIPRGGIQTVEPTLMVYDSEHPEGVPYDGEVSWKFEWYEGDGDPHGDDLPHVQIQDADDRLLTQNEDGGDYGKAPFKVQRIIDWDGDPRIIAMIDDGDGEFEAARMDLYLEEMDFDDSFIVPFDRGNDWETWFYPTETVSVAPGRKALDDYIAAGYPIEISLEYGSGYDEDDNIRPIYIYEPDEDGYRGEPKGEFHFSSAEFSEKNGLKITSEDRFYELQELLRYQNDEYGHRGSDMVICLTASLNGFMISERDIWVRFWDEYREMEDDNKATIPGRDFIYYGGNALLYVEDPEHSSGNDRDDEPGEYYDVFITDIKSSNNKVLKPEKEGDTWRIHGIRPGNAEITYTFTGGPLGDTPDTHTTTLHVNDVVYWQEPWDENDEQNDYYEVLIGEEVPFRPVVIRQEYTGEDEPLLQILDSDKCDLEYNEYDEQIVRIDSYPFFAEIAYDYDDNILDYDADTGKFTGIRTGETYIGTEIWVYEYPENEEDEPEEVWYSDSRVHVSVSTSRAEVVLPEGAELKVSAGQNFTAMTIVRQLGAELIVYSLKNPDGESIEIADAWLGYVDDPLAIVENQRVLTVPVDALDDEEELEEDGTLRRHLWFSACASGGRFIKDADIDVVVKPRKLFKDVTDPTEFYFEPIYWAAELGITTGYDDNTFRPMNECNRAAVVTFLWRIAGQPQPKKMASFKDMTKNADFDKAISWAAEEGITTGYNDNTFRPWAICNRAAIVTFIWRYAGRPEPKKMASFKDMTKNSDFDKAISWAAEQDITTGWADNTFRPWDTCKRLAVVTFLHRFAV
ncbi:MAG: S-layer homology domain-containing protein [Blautia sp.]|nr:S-layer homology domain-containing protein [Blautia sp.]